MINLPLSNVVYIGVILGIAVLSIVANIVGLYIHYSLKSKKQLAVSHRGHGAEKTDDIEDSDVASTCGSSSISPTRHRTNGNKA